MSEVKPPRAPDNFTDSLRAALELTTHESDLSVDDFMSLWSRTHAQSESGFAACCTSAPELVSRCNTLPFVPLPSDYFRRLVKIRSPQPECLKVLQARFLELPESPNLLRKMQLDESSDISLVAAHGVASLLNFLPPADGTGRERDTYSAFLRAMLGEPMLVPKDNGGLIVDGSSDQQTVPDMHLKSGTVVVEAAMGRELESWTSHKDVGKVMEQAWKWFAARGRTALYKPRTYILFQVTCGTKFTRQPDPGVLLHFAFIRPLPLIVKDEICALELRCVYEDKIEISETILDDEQDVQECLAKMLRITSLAYALGLANVDRNLRCTRKVKGLSPLRAVLPRVSRGDIDSTTTVKSNVALSVGPGGSDGWTAEMKAAVKALHERLQGTSTHPAFRVNRVGGWATVVYVEHDPDSAAEVVVIKVYPTAKKEFLEPELYKKLYLLDSSAVPDLVAVKVYGPGVPNNGYGMRLVQLHDLRADDVADAMLLAEWYPTAKSFVHRVLYLLGLVFVSGIVHGDIKLSNFALDRQGRLMLIDFSGSAFDKRPAPALVEPRVPRGEITSVTAGYRAEELDDKTVVTVDSRVDVYCCGIMLTNLLENLGKIWRTEQGWLGDLCSVMTAKDVKVRPSWLALLEHPVLTAIGRAVRQEVQSKLHAPAAGQPPAATKPAAAAEVKQTAAVQTQFVAAGAEQAQLALQERRKRSKQRKRSERQQGKRRHLSKDEV